MKTKLVLALFLLAPFAARADGPSAVVAPPAEVKKDGPPRFAGFKLDYTLADSTGLNAPNYHNELAQYFEPAWAIGQRFFRGTRFSSLEFSGRFVLIKPLAGYDDSYYSAGTAQGPVTPCSNLLPDQNGNVTQTPNRCPTTGPNRLGYSDIWLTLANPKIATIPVLKININPSLRAYFPTSAESQAATLRFSGMASLGASRSFFNDKLSISYSFGATKNFHQYTTARIVLGTNLNPNGTIDNSYTTGDLSNFYSDPSRLNNTIGGYNTSFSFSHAFKISYVPTDKLSFSVLYIVLDGFAYEARCGDQLYGNVVTDPCVNANNVAKSSNGVGTAGRRHSDQQVFWAVASYQALDWLGFSLAWINWEPLRKADNSLRNPFISYDYNAYTSVSLSATVSIEKAAAKIF